MKRWLAFVAAFGFASTAAAQDYPYKPVHVVHGFAAGGGADLVVRAIQPKAVELLGQQFVIEYKIGAGGNLAMDTVAHAAPDGYTLLLGTPGLAINPALYRKLPFDPLKDFAPVALVGVTQNVLVVNPKVPAKNVVELIALLKARPGKFSFASSGYGTSLHLAGELFKVLTGTELVHVPYKGSNQAIADVMAGQPEIMFNVLPSSLPLRHGTAPPHPPVPGGLATLPRTTYQPPPATSTSTPQPNAAGGTPAPGQRGPMEIRAAMSAEKFDAINRAQMPDAEKRARANVVIENDGTVEALHEKLACLIGKK